MIAIAPLFENRRQAGRELARALADFADQHPVILALPRGGVPVAYEVAVALHAPLDLLLVRKIGAPGHPEYGIGAMVDGNDPQLVTNEDMITQLGVPTEYIEQTAQRELAEIERRRAAYLGDRMALPLHGRTVIVVDDGIATGGTMHAALRGLRKAGVQRIVVGVPVGPADTLASLRDEAHEVVCLATPDPFFAVGPHYRDFTQISDRQVVVLMEDVCRQVPAQRN